MRTSWRDLIQIDKKWVNRQLSHHFSDLDKKVGIRLYTLRASGTILSPSAICSELSGMLVSYVSGKHDLDQKEAIAAHSYAVKFFGEKNTQTDGKYGELLLFALVESVLECKMIAHKIRSLSNFKDQVKGGDGIFLGEYLVEGEMKPAYLIGESKVQASYSDAINEALSSLNRFHDEETSAEFNSTELIIAKQNLIMDDRVDLDEMYARLTPTEDLFRSQILVHPVLIMYNTGNIPNLERESKDANSLELLIKDEVLKKKDSIKKLISDKVKTYKNIQKVYLDFFIIPTNQVDAFRNAMYYEIHGTPYQKKEKK